MLILNASEEARSFPYTNGTMFTIEKNSPFVQGDAPNEKGEKVPHIFAAEVWLVKAIYGRATLNGQKPDMGIIIDADEYNNVVEAIGTPDPAFVFQTLEQAKAVLVDGKPKKTDLQNNVKVAYDLKFDELKKEIAEKDAEIATLTGSVEAMKLNEAAHVDEINKLKAELAKLKSEKADVVVKLNALRSDYSEKELELKAERETNEKKTAYIEKLEASERLNKDTIAQMNRNATVAGEAYSKLNQMFSNVIAQYGMREVEKDVWRIPATVDEAKNTIALQDLVTRYDLKLFEGKYYLPGDVPSIDKPKAKK